MESQESSETKNIGGSNLFNIQPSEVPEINEEEKITEGVEEVQDEEETKDKDLKFDRAKGAIMGALCGDAIGAVLEFYHK